jgi:hypothetical protein
LTFFFPLTDGHCHAHAHIINAQHNCLIAPFSNASKQYSLGYSPIKYYLLRYSPIRAEKSFSPLTEFIVPVPPPSPLLRSKKNQLKIDDNFVISRSVNFHGMSFKLVSNYQKWKSFCRIPFNKEMNKVKPQQFYTFKMARDMFQTPIK